MKELKYKEKDRVLICACAQILDVEPNDPRNNDYFVEIDKCDFMNNEGWISEDDILCELGYPPRVDYDEGYEQGLKDAWEMAKLITLMPHDGGVSSIELMDAYSTESTYDILKRYSAQEAINKYNEWKESNVFKMGDIVEYDIDERTICRSIFLYEGFNCHWVLTSDYEAPQQLPKAYFKLRKVGESGLDIAGALAKICERED